VRTPPMINRRSELLVRPIDIRHLLCSCGSPWPATVSSLRGELAEHLVCHSQTDMNEVTRKRSSGANLGATGTDDLQGLRTGMNSQPRCVPGHGLI
jgi:hypothetical protein